MRPNSDARLRRAHQTRARAAVPPRECRQTLARAELCGDLDLRLGESCGQHKLERVRVGELEVVAVQPPERRGQHALPFKLSAQVVHDQPLRSGLRAPVLRAGGRRRFGCKRTAEVLSVRRREGACATAVWERDAADELD